MDGAEEALQLWWCVDGSPDEDDELIGRYGIYFTPTQVELIWWYSRYFTLIPVEFIW